MMNEQAQQWIERLGLQRHPEGGWFKEVYRSAGMIRREHLPSHYSGDRSYSTSIYFMLEGNDYSAFHRLRSDEIWFYHNGGPLWLHIIHQDASLETVRIGKNHDEGDLLQKVIPAGCWFAARPSGPDDYTLLGCTVSPGFDFSDFELAVREELIERYPQHAALITEFTR